MEWKKQAERIQKVGYKRVTLKDFELPNGSVAEFTTWGTKTNNVAVIALTASGKVVVARQFRPGPESILDELPGGAVETGEDPAIAAARELLEETGYASNQPLEALGVACRDAYTNELSHYFLARNCIQTAEQALDEHEFVDIAEITIGQLIKNAKTGKMSDAVAVLMAYDQLRELQRG